MLLPQFLLSTLSEDHFLAAHFVNSLRNVSSTQPTKQLQNIGPVYFTVVQERVLIAKFTLRSQLNIFFIAHVFYISVKKQ